MPTIPGYPSAGPLDGTEQIPLWQGGQQVQAQLNEIVDLASSAADAAAAEATASADGAVAAAAAAEASASIVTTIANILRVDCPPGWFLTFSMPDTGQIPGGINDQGELEFVTGRFTGSVYVGELGGSLDPSSSGVLSGTRDQNDNYCAYIDDNGVSQIAEAEIGTLNGVPGGAIAKLLGDASINLGSATRLLSPLNGQSLALGEGATADPISNAGAIALTTDQPYGNKMFHGGVRPDDINGLASGTFDLTSLVPHIEAALTSVGDPTGCGETSLGGFQAMMAQLLNAYGIAPINTPFEIISFAPGQGSTAIASFRSGGSLFTRFMNCVTAGKSLSSGQNVQMPWHLWMQGESGEDDDGYITELTGLAAEVDSSARAILTSQTDPVVTFTYQLDRAIAAHWYTEAAKQSTLVRIVGPMYPYQIAGWRGAQFDNVHRLAPAYQQYGATAAVAVFCHYFLKRPWRPLQWSYDARGNLRCRVDGSDLIIKYDVPHGGALAFDTPCVDYTVGSVANGNRWARQYGFYLLDSSAVEKPISDVKIEGRDEIRLVGASAVATDVLCAGFKDATLNTAQSVLTNLRDCQGDVITFDDGGGIPIHNWAIGQQHTFTSGELS